MCKTSQQTLLKDMWMTIKSMKTYYHQSSGKYTLKPYWNTITHPPEWFKLKWLSTPNVGKNMK